MYINQKKIPNFNENIKKLDFISRRFIVFEISKLPQTQTDRLMA